MDLEKFKERAFGLASTLYVLALLAVSVYLIGLLTQVLPETPKYIMWYVFGMMCALLIGMVMNVFDKDKVMNLDRIAGGVNIFRRIHWDASDPQGYFYLIKNLLGKTVDFGIEALDDLLVFLRSLVGFVTWIIICFATVTGLMFIYRLYKIPQLARASKKYRHSMETMIRKQWPIFAAERKYAKKNGHEREKLRHEFRMRWKMPDDSILMSMEKQVCKGRS
jgi:hypothetical protein